MSECVLRSAAWRTLSRSPIWASSSAAAFSRSAFRAASACRTLSALGGLSRLDVSH